MFTDLFVRFFICPIYDAILDTRRAVWLSPVLQKRKDKSEYTERRISCQVHRDNSFSDEGSASNDSSFVK